MMRGKNSILLVNIILMITTVTFLFSELSFAVLEQHCIKKNFNNPQCAPDESTVKSKNVQGSNCPEEERLMSENPNYVKGQVIIKLRDNTYLNTIQKDLQVRSMEPVFKHLKRLPDRSKPTAVFKKAMLKAEAIRASALKRGLDRVHLIHLPPGVSVESVLKRYKADYKVEYIQPNYIYQPDLVPNDPRYYEQYSHRKTHAKEAWDIETGGEDVTIAVIGTGVEIDHPDLAANIWTNEGEMPGDTIDNDGIDNDGNGYIDDVYGWDFVDNDNDPRPGGG